MFCLEAGLKKALADANVADVSMAQANGCWGESCSGLMRWFSKVFQGLQEAVGSSPDVVKVDMANLFPTPPDEA